MYNFLGLEGLFVIRTEILDQRSFLKLFDVSKYISYIGCTKTTLVTMRRCRLQPEHMSFPQ